MRILSEILTLSVSRGSRWGSHGCDEGSNCDCATSSDCRSLLSHGCKRPHPKKELWNLSLQINVKALNTHLIFHFRLPLTICWIYIPELILEIKRSGVIFFLKCNFVPKATLKTINTFFYKEIKILKLSWYIKIGLQSNVQLIIKCL